MSDTGDRATALVSRVAELPPHLQTPNRTSWIASRVGIALLVLLAMPLVSRIGYLVPGVPPWVWLVAYVIVIGRGAHRVLVGPTVRSSEDIQQAITMVRDGDMEASRAHLDAALQRARGAMVAPLATMLGAVEIELGNVERGLAILESVRTSGWNEREGQSQPRGLVYASMAAAHAELGDHDAAAAAMLQADADLGATGRGWLLADRLHVLARAGKWSDVVQHFAADLDAAEQLMPAWSIRSMRVLHALARSRLSLDHVGGEYRAEANEEIATALADPRVRASMRRWITRWPELRAFLASQGITRY